MAQPVHIFWFYVKIDLFSEMFIELTSSVLVSKQLKACSVVEVVPLVLAGKFTFNEF